MADGARNSAERSAGSLHDVEGVCAWALALVPLGWLEAAAVVEVGAY